MAIGMGNPAEHPFPPPLVIGIAGPSCSGKSGLARELQQRLESHDPVIFPLDAYYRDLSHLSRTEGDKRNFDTPDALEWPLLEEHFTRLRHGETIERPVYNFARHIREPDGVPLGPAGLIIVEGLFALLSDSMRKRYDLSVYLEIEEEVSFNRRLDRDVTERGIDRDLVERQFTETVLPMARKFVAPTISHANLLLDGEAPLTRSTGLVIRFLGL